MQLQNNKTNLKARQPRVQNAAAQAQLIAQAKQGDVQAIQELMGAPLKSKAIWVRVKRKESTLHVSMTGKSSPNQKSCLDYVKRGLTKLGLVDIETAHVTGYQTGKFNPVWTEDIHLTPTPQRTRAWEPGARIRSSHLQAKGTTGQNRSGEGHPKKGHPRTATSEPKGGFSVWAIAALLLSVLAIGGITWAVLNTPNTQRPATPDSVQ